VGDLFLMRSFRSIGSGRTLMIFSFNPLFISVASYFIFSQALKPTVFIGIVFLSACLLMLGLESFQREKAWKLSGYFQALLAAFLDSTGVLLTRWAFEEDSSLTLASANFLRGAGALLGFFILSRYYPIYIWSRFKSLELRLKKLVLTVCVLGTFVSLLMWLGAVRIGPLGVVSAVSVTGPLLVTVVETYVEGRRAGWQLYLAVAFFLLGVWVINFMAS
jgi:drug/metabolite transporter (DMT)-like permease